jgi:hypothetical protein
MRPYDHDRGLIHLPLLSPPKCVVRNVQGRREEVPEPLDGAVFVVAGET